MANDGCWREFLFSHTPEQVYRFSPAEFRRFIEAPRSEGGCQTPLYVLERLTRGTEAWGAFLDLTRGEPGAQPGDVRNPEGVNQHSEGGGIKCDTVTLNPTSKPPTGNSISYARRRLKRERPDLLARVESGELTSNAAMLLAGLREPQLTIPTDPRKAARRLVKHLTRQQFSELVDEAIKLYAEAKP